MTNHTTKGELVHGVGRTFDWGQLDIFSLPPASRTNDPLTSKIAGNRAEARYRKDGKLSELQSQVLVAFRINGPMTDETLENLPVFKYPDGRNKYAHTTVRCRRVDLCRLGLLVEHGLMSNSNGSPMTIWAVKDP